MAVEKFSKKEAIRFGWETAKSNFGFFALLFIIIWLISFFPDFLAGLARERIPLFYYPIKLSGFILSTLVSMGLIKIALKFCDREKGEFSDLFSQHPLIFKYFIASILYGLIVVAGTILFIVPGIILGLKFFFYDYFIIDEKCAPIEAFKKSSDATRVNKWNLFVFLLMILGINLLGLLAFLVGLLLTLPTTMVATAFVYRKLSGKEEAVLVPEKGDREEDGGKEFL